jgi:glycosyltransferase involved in cell wall biosynthesis
MTVEPRPAAIEEATSPAVAISVIMPSLNSGPFVGEALRSALTQSPPPHDVIVQDGGSTDGTLDVLKSLGDAISWRSEPDLGQSDALNRAIERASGNVIIWLNADDALVTGAFAAATEAFAQHPDTDFVYGDFELMTSDGRVLRRYRSSPYDPERVFRHGSYIFSGSIFYRRELLQRVGPFDDRLHACMDFDYLVRLGSARAVHLGRPIARFRMSGAGKSSTMRARFLRESHSIRWRTAGRSKRLRVLTLLLDLHDAISLWTQPLRLTRAWSVVRRSKRL